MAHEILILSAKDIRRLVSMNALISAVHKVVFGARVQGASTVGIRMHG